MQYKIHTTKSIGDQSLHTIKIKYRELDPGLYYWVGTTDQAYKVILIIGNYILGKKQ